MSGIYTGIYPVNDYRYYLAHHGVKGMKWGVRKYQNYDGSLTAAGKQRMASDGTGFKTRMKIRLQGLGNDIRDTYRSTRDAKGIVNKASELVGHGRGETHQRNRMYTQQRLKAASKTKLFKHLHDVRSANAKYNAEYHSIKRGQSLKRRVGEFFVPITLAKKPVRTLTGRDTRRGYRYLDNIITGGTAGIGISVARLASKNVRTKYDKQAKSMTNEYYREAKASYDKSQKAIKEYESNNKKKKK